MVVPNLRVSEMTMDELRAMLNVCYSIYLGINLEEADEEIVQTLCRECIVYHGKLYVWKLRELFGYYCAGKLKGMESVKPEIHSKFIYKMKKAYFDNL